MKKKDVERDNEKWYFEQVNRISKKLLKILFEESHNEMSNVPSYPKRLIENHALFNMMKIVNFPIFIMTVEKDGDQLKQQYNEFAESLSEEVLEICEAFYNWKP